MAAVWLASHRAPAEQHRHYDQRMVTPRKRKNSRTENRANQRYTPPGTGAQDGEGGSIPRPPSSCQPWHFYWCDGHDDWHHHDEFVVTAIERSMGSAEE